MSRERTTAGGPLGRMAALALALHLLALALSGIGAAAQNGEVPGRVSASADIGFARIVFDFAGPIEHRKTVDAGVLIVDFDRTVAVDMSRLAAAIPDYLVAARLDPMGESVRFALAQPVAVNTIAVGHRLYVDLLPSSWVGPPPGLPQEVVAELIEEAERSALAAARARPPSEPVEPPLEVRVGRYPTFSRIVFNWLEPTPTVLSRSGNVVTLDFGREAEPELAGINAEPPPRLVRATAGRGEEGLRVTLEVEPGTDVRGFRQGVTYVVDLAAAGPSGDVAARIPGFDDRPPLPDNTTGAEEILFPVVPVDGVEARSPAPTPESLVSVSVTPLELDGEAAAGSPPGRPSGDEGVAGRPAAEAGALPGRAADGVAAGADQPARPPVDGAAKGGRTRAGPAEGRGPRSPVPVAVSVKSIGSTLQLGFPFRGQVAAAAFQRGTTLWLVFDTDAVLDLSAVRSEDGRVIREFRVNRSGDMQVVRLALTGPFLATAAARAHQWIVSIGDLVLEPTTPLALERALRTDGRSKVVVDIPNSGRVHWLADTEFADQIAVVTAYGPPRGLVKRQEFVEFTALPTAHGLAIQPHADDLAVRLIQDEVSITRNDGLTVSAGQWPRYLPGRVAAADGARPGFIDFELWSHGGPAEFHDSVSRLRQAIAAGPSGQRVGERLQLARLYLAHELGAEALGSLQIAAEEDPEVLSDPAYLAMRGVSRLILGHTEEARADLTRRELTLDPYSALWRSLIEFREGHYRETLLEFADGMAALDAYPPRQRARFRLASTRAALELGELESATRDLDALDETALDERSAAEATLLRARLAQALGEVREAARGYEAAAASDVRPIAVEAQFRGVELALAEGQTTPAAAIEELERLSMAWRGDGLELAILRRLGDLYRDQGRYREALETMKMAVVTHKGDERSRFIADEMSNVFDHLFLEDGADRMEPVAALGLYYDFRELTPVGRRGDEMIRRLAERLIEVDLLDQAAALLDHQVSNRLNGVARAEVAADLSFIYLTAHQPENALRALRESHQPELPAELSRKRTLLEARALSELGRAEIAMELLDTLSGDDVEKARADVLWRGELWQRAGEQIERLLGARWRDPEPLTDDERLDVMRIAIAYVFAGDKLGLDRLRRKYAAQMAESPDANAFDLVTWEVDPEDVTFRNLAAEIARIDTLDAFLAEFRARYGEGTVIAAGGSSS